MPWKKTKSGYKKKGQKKGGNIKRPKQYEALRRRGVPKKMAARIANRKRKKKR